MSEHEELPEIYYTGIDGYKWRMANSCHTCGRDVESTAFCLVENILCVHCETKLHQFNCSYHVSNGTACNCDWNPSGPRSEAVVAPAPRKEEEPQLKGFARFAQEMEDSIVHLSEQLTEATKAGASHHEIISISEMIRRDVIEREKFKAMDEEVSHVKDLLEEIVSELQDVSSEIDSLKTEARNN